MMGPEVGRACQLVLAKFSRNLEGGVWLNLGAKYHGSFFLQISLQLHSAQNELFSFPCTKKKINNFSLSKLMMEEREREMEM